MNCKQLLYTLYLCLTAFAFASCNNDDEPQADMGSIQISKLNVGINSEWSVSRATGDVDERGYNGPLKVKFVEGDELAITITRTPDASSITESYSAKNIGNDNWEFYNSNGDPISYINFNSTSKSELKITYKGILTEEYSELAFRKEFDSAWVDGSAANDMGVLKSDTFATLDIEMWYNSILIEFDVITDDNCPTIKSVYMNTSADMSIHNGGYEMTNVGNGKYQLVKVNNNTLFNKYYSTFNIYGFNVILDNHDNRYICKLNEKLNLFEKKLNTCYRYTFDLAAEINNQ